MQIPRKWNTIVSLVCVLSLFVGVFGPVSHARAVTVDGLGEKPTPAGFESALTGLFDSAQEVETKKVELNEARKKELISEAKDNSSNLKHNQIDFNNATVVGIKMANGVEYVVQAPYVGSVEKGSFVSIVFDKSKKKIRQIEFIAKSLNEKWVRLNFG